MKKVFIDGSAGTTGLRIAERLSTRTDIELIKLNEENRKDINARKEALNSADIAFLCLPDSASREAVSLIENSQTVVLDTSTAHRTDDGWAYGFPELSEKHREKIKKSKRIAVPGCHASGFIALVYPLIEAGVLPKNSLLSCFSLTGYSGGGKNMIAEYEGEGRDKLLNAPRQYGIAQTHKHLPEMVKYGGIENAPAFIPVVADFYSGMEVTVPIFASNINATIDQIKEIYKRKYTGPIVKFTEDFSENGFVSANKLSFCDGMEISVGGNGDRILLIARYDNLGKGASGAAIECMNIVLGTEETTGLDL
ncbi:MAG: N-acetyl-gamma-glutamyl-phosphate reductase [Acutalibacteraceae bacterium]|jgi:N-acetyl-gamma-glutamyl-phosphate reductase|nr:N-acetyl-gamma-glutamyl-phosphate reductase [Acutalibacteraceae bacterium]